jgi:hypothetical protein
MNRLFALTLLVPLLASPAVHADDLAAGNWKITSLTANGEIALTSWLLKLETTGGKTTATLASANPSYPTPTLKSFMLKGDTVRIVLLVGGVNEQIFAGRLAGKDGMKVVGTLGTEELFYPAWMTPTDITELDKADIVKGAGAAGAGLAALNKLRVAKKDTPDDDLVKWSETASKDAVTYGPAWQSSCDSAIASALLKHPTQVALAVEHAQAAVKSLDATASPTRQIKVLETLALALQSAGRLEAGKDAMERVARLDRMLDKEYLAQGLPFKPDVFAGRKTDSRRAVVLELFTGAQCPPCVAADLAFDALQKTYKPSELVLIQYHMHIPGPDPLTNNDTEARWNHYRKAFGKQIGGVPTAIINGKTLKVGGGPLAFAGKTYNAYREMIDPLLETPAVCQVKASAGRRGDVIDIQAEVTAMASPGPDKMLRLVLVEEVVAYGGGNKVRLHHHVVRALPGGADGKAITDRDLQVKASLDIAELRKSLTAYLDGFVAARGPFPRLIRPMEMRDLRVIALVQDDTTHEILQAAQVGVGEPQ